MPYNAKTITDFLEKVNSQAEAAAQAVYDKHQSEWECRVKAQLRRGDNLITGNGVAVFSGGESEAKRKYADAVAQYQWTHQRAGFTGDDYTKP